MEIKISVPLILIGLLAHIDFSESRAVNVSNTWTLPQAGFNVFYRYFRDKISWFEADAVCQFHHANLVTIENIEQFDAARQFLKELDIPDYVWIGLMRPSNTDQFSWTNSKPLPLSEGYWAEPWPISETPLCAVIDPTRDYRWHALRCGGPETAAFLCEMEIPDWALHCTENPDITVQYISDSGAVQLSKACNDTIKEISCQSKVNKIEMYDALKCPEDEEASTTLSSTTTSQDYEPKVIIKNPQKMMEDILNSISVDNRLDEAEAQQKMDFDLMMGDQPDDKKTLLKLADKKETFPKKSKKKSEQLKVKDDEEEQMQGDAPAEEVTNDSSFVTTTDRQRRNANLVEDTTTSIVELTSTTELPAETTNVEDLSSSISSTELPSTTEQITTIITTEESTTKFIVQGHPLHMSQAVFKEPIAPDVNNTHERIEIGESEDRFIPPMLLVKAKLTTTTEIVGKEVETTIDASTSSTDQTLIEITEVSQTSENETQVTTEVQSETLITSEKPIVVEKRNDPRMGLKATNLPAATVTQSDELISTTDYSTSSSSDDSSSPFSVTTEEIIETTVDVSPETPKIDDAIVQKLIALPISETTPKTLVETTNHKSTTTMRNDINAYHKSEDTSREEEDYERHHHHDENNFSNAENFQPYKPNRHRSITKNDHHHGAGFAIGKILG